MWILDALIEKKDAIAEAGPKAIAAAKQDGVAVYYEDPKFGDGIVEEQPDGKKRLLRKTAVRAA